MAPSSSSAQSARTRPRPRARSRPQGVPKEPEEAAAAANLRYVTSSEPGITRKRAGKGFTYLGPDGERVEDPATLERIDALAVPPAWTDVWICRDGRGHLQATGRDDRGRKQYRYHASWRKVRDRVKYDTLVEFGNALPALRERVETDLGKKGLPREKVLALVVRLLDETCMRVGNEEYASENGSFGVTTLRDRHADVGNGRVRFRYRAKHGKDREVEVRDGRLAKLVRKCRDIPGQELFQYVDGDGEHRPVRSDDVNAYVHDATGADFTAKDFRTWAGTVLAARFLHEHGAVDTKKEAEAAVRDAVKDVAATLGNTPRITKASYVHPGIPEAYVEERCLDLPRSKRKGLTDEEARVLRFLEGLGD